MNRPAWTISEAVERTEASRSTIRRYRDAGKFPHSYKDSKGVWRFPLEDLLAAGLQVTAPAQSEHMDQPTEHDHTSAEHVTESLLNKVTELERALAVEQARNAGLERLAQAAQENVLDLRRALRMIEATPSEHMSIVRDQPVNTLTEQGMSTPEQPTEQPEPRPRWRGFFARSRQPS